MRNCIRTRLNQVFWTIGAISCLLIGCGPNPRSSYLSTDFGAVGNLEVERRFARYVVAHPDGCGAPSTDRPRVLVTGFGLFSGVDFNISGVIANTIGNPKLLRSPLRLTKQPPLAGVDLGALQEEDSGARIQRRRLKIGSQDYDMCLMTLDVIWDLSAAIIVTEMRRFQPDLVIMTGLGGMVANIESAALNDTRALTGFAWNGLPIKDNAPVSDYVLPSNPHTHVSELSWDAVAVYRAILPTVEESGWAITVADDARPDNNYICNNVSYVVNEAAKGTEVELAGGKIRFPPSKVNMNTKIGFLHFSAYTSDAVEAVAFWIQILGNVIHAARADE